MSDKLEKNLWKELDRIAFIASAVAIVLLCVAYYFIGLTNPTPGTSNFVLRAFMLDVIANLIPAFLLFAGSYAVFRRIQALRSQREVEELASTVSAKVMDPLKSDLDRIKEELAALGSESPASLLPARRLLTQVYEEKTAKATQVDIITLTMETLLSHYSEDRLVQWILHEGKRIRILVLAPDALATRIRGREEGIDLAAKIVHQMDRLRRLYGKVQERVEDCSEQCKGSLEVRAYDSLPYFAYFRADAEMVIGLYYSHQEGLNSECIYLNRSEHPVFHKMQGHFDALWSGKIGADTPLESRIICQISSSGFYFKGVKGPSITS